MKSVKDAADYNGELSRDDFRTVTIAADSAGKRIDQALARLLPDYSRSRLQQWIRSGNVTVDGERCSVTTKVWGGEKVVVQLQADADALAYLPEDIALDIAFEDPSILVVNKPVGLVVHPGSGNWSGTLLNALLRHVPTNSGLPRAGIVHRLDKDTSGLLVVAKTLESYTELIRQLQDRSVTREYVAVARGVVDADGTVDAPIGRHPRDRKRMAVVERGKPARTHYSVLERGADWTLLQCRLETGRTHQIRVHLASIGHALVGEQVYKTRSQPASRQEIRDFPRQALHASRLQLKHPLSDENMTWVSPLPADMAELLNSLRSDREDS